ncbi:hypothetical protein N7539_009200 [Penicillium diatomitis]|uniref:Uncharacterized protein n=1 Tax=Penicillium diatomitis TaxID=2819901 RepID=A0A9X0BJU4_9EURO|nr:uncharacterized protein N7539_009200 [Penicillium diatomitis]KAJ5469582.1 hypothetical protein N7539_009200 [Penicillium diatomitis]
MTNSTPTVRSGSSANSRSTKMPGVRCPNCYAKGQEVWVIPGKSCHVCHTPCA